MEAFEAGELVGRWAAPIGTIILGWWFVSWLFKKKKKDETKKD